MKFVIFMNNYKKLQLSKLKNGIIAISFTFGGRKTMGLTLHEAIEKHNITVGDLSLVTGVNAVSIYNFLKGNTNPKEKTYQKLRMWEPELEMKFVKDKVIPIPNSSWLILRDHDKGEWTEPDSLPGYLFHFNEAPENISRVTGIPLSSLHDYLKGEKMLTEDEKDRLYDLGIDYFPKIIYDNELGRYIPKQEEVILSKREIEISRLIERISLSGGKIYGIKNNDIGILCARLHKMGFQYRKWVHPKYGGWCVDYRTSVKWKLKLKPEPIKQEWIFEFEEGETEFIPTYTLKENAHPKIKGQMALF